MLCSANNLEIIIFSVNNLNIILKRNLIPAYHYTEDRPLSEKKAEGTGPPFGHQAPAEDRCFTRP